MVFSDLLFIRILEVHIDESELCMFSFLLYFQYVHLYSRARMINLSHFGFELLVQSLQLVHICRLRRPPYNKTFSLVGLGNLCRQLA